MDGAAVGLLAYPGSVRPVDDVALLIERGSVGGAVRALSADGWQTSHVDSGGSAAHQFACGAVVERRGVRVGLHWDLLPGERQVTRDSVELGRAAGSRPTLRPEALLFAWLANPRHQQRGALLWEADVRRLLQLPRIDPDEVAGMVRTRGAVRVVRRSLGELERRQAVPLQTSRRLTTSRSTRTPSALAFDLRVGRPVPATELGVVTRALVGTASFVAVTRDLTPLERFTLAGRRVGARRPTGSALPVSTPPTDIRLLRSVDASDR